MSKRGACFALALVALAACGRSAELVEVNAAQTTTSSAPRPLPSEVALTFVTRAIAGEDVSDMVIDERATDAEGHFEPAPELPAEIAARATNELAGSGATAENASVVRSPGDPILGPGCTIPADITVVCSIITRNSFGSGTVSVAIRQRAQSAPSPDLRVFTFQVVDPLGSFTG